jgi:hypothetical protein
MESSTARRKRVSILAIFMLLQAAWLMPASMAAVEGTTPAAVDETSLFSDILGMLDGLTADSESEASPFQPPGFGSTPPGLGGTPPGLTTPPGLGGTPPGQTFDEPMPPGQDGEVPPGHEDNPVEE